MGRVSKKGIGGKSIIEDIDDYNIKINIRR